jgi:hypothetical protein
MSPSNEDKLILLLTEIRSDIRQMKSDLQSLLRFLRQQQEKPSPPPPSISDDTPNDVERAQSGSPEDVLRYLREREARMMRASEQAEVGCSDYISGRVAAALGRASSRWLHPATAAGGAISINGRNSRNGM